MTRYQNWMYRQPTERLAHLLRGIDGIEKSVPEARAMIVRERCAIVSEVARRLYPTQETVILEMPRKSCTAFRLARAIMHTMQTEWKTVAMVAIPSAITIYGAARLSGIVP